MALRQPEKKNLQVLVNGADRENVITYLGAPVNTEVVDENRVDIYKFTQGYSGATKASRALFHAVADVFTFFIWEIVATPAEAIFDGTETTIRVVYDKNNKIKDVAFLKQSH